MSGPMLAPVQDLPVEAIRWTLDDSSPWPPSRRVLDLAIGMLPTLTDDLAAGLVEELALTVADLREEATALRTALCAALAHGHAQQLEIRRLSACVAQLQEARRPETRRATR